MKQKLVLLMAVLLLSGCGAASSSPAVPTTGNIFIALPNNDLLRVAASDLRAGLQASVQLVKETVPTAPIVGELLKLSAGQLLRVGLVGNFMTPGGASSVQQALEGDANVSFGNGVRVYANRVTGAIRVVVEDPELTARAAAQILLENPTAAKEVAEGTQAKADAGTQVELDKSQPMKPAAIVVSDDDPADLAEMARNAVIVMAKIGYVATPIACLNDIACVLNGALAGGPNGTQAAAVFLDGGFLGLEMPADSPYPSVPALTHKGKMFAAGPWIALYIKHKGYRGAIFYVSTEGWNTIRQFEGKHLGPTYMKEWFFSQPGNFAGEIESWILKALTQ